MLIYILESKATVKVVLTDYPERVLNKLHSSAPYEFNVTKEYKVSPSDFKLILQQLKPLQLITIRSSDYFNAQTNWTTKKDYVKSQVRIIMNAYSKTQPNLQTQNP